MHKLDKVELSDIYSQNDIGLNELAIDQKYML